MARSLYCGKLITLSSLRARVNYNHFLLVRFDHRQSIEWTGNAS